MHPYYQCRPPPYSSPHRPPAATLLLLNATLLHKLPLPVQWRNLVKFRHITAEESRTLKPKTSGPWSRKHSACAQDGCVCGGVGGVNTVPVRRTGACVAGWGA